MSTSRTSSTIGIHSSSRAGCRSVAAAPGTAEPVGVDAAADGAAEPAPEAPGAGLPAVAPLPSAARAAAEPGAMSLSPGSNRSTANRTGPVSAGGSEAPGDDAVPDAAAEGEAEPAGAEPDAAGVGEAPRL